LNFTNQLRESTAGSEIEFLQRRLEILKETIERPSKFEIDEKGGFHMRLDISPHIEHAFIREAHLVQKTIIASKRRAGISRFECLAKIARQKIAAHREFYSPMQEAYDG